MTMARLLTVMTLCCLTACKVTPVAQPPTASNSIVTELDGPLAQLQVDTRQLYQRMLKLTENKQCQQHSDCKVLAVGKRACGGPEQFMPFSVLQTDQKLLQYTQERYSKLKQEQQQRLGMVSTCQMLPEPAAACQANLCVLQPATGQ